MGYPFLNGLGADLGPGARARFQPGSTNAGSCGKFVPVASLTGVSVGVVLHRRAD